MVLELFMVVEKEKLTLTVATAGELLGVSRPQAYKLARLGQIPVLRLGRRLVVPKEALSKMLSEIKPTFQSEKGSDVR
jgi:excisionase family DNA binding protein